MIEGISSKINKFFSGHERSIKLKKNVIASFIFKIISMATGFIMVPVCLNYLDRERYGIWLTVSSFLIWFNFFEIGLGSGLRNKLGESLAVKDYFSAKKYVSTAYAILVFIVSILMIIFWVLHRFIDWTKVFNSGTYLSAELSILLLVVLQMFFLKFVFKLISVILFADQRSGLASSIDTLGNLLALIGIFIISKTADSSLLYLGIILSACPLIVLIIFNIVLFKNEYKKISPSLKFVDLKSARDLFGLSISFFIIEICGLVLYQSSNIIISHSFGPSEVTPYNIAYKLFSIMSMLFIILITPFWSAFTEAWKNEDIEWIKKSISKLVKIWLMIAVAGMLLLVFSKSIYLFWVGESVEISFQLSALLYLYFLIFTFGGIFNMFINGVGKIRIQLIVSITGSLLFYPLSYVFINKLNFGINGLVTAMILVNILGIIFTPLQFNKIIKKKASGIWNK